MLVASTSAALLVLAELALILPRIFVVSLYCVIVAAANRSRATLMLLAADYRD